MPSPIERMITPADIGLYVLDANEQPVLAADLLTWCRAMEDASVRRVAETQLDAAWVSTVFLGIDQNHGRFLGLDQTPVLYETRVFGGPRHGQMDRYTNRADALAGHLAMVEHVRGRP